MMLKNEIHPSSIAGIKRLARQLKKASGQPLHEALDEASRAAYFENFNHARSKLKNAPFGHKNRHQLFLTIYWQDRKTWTAGRETLEITLTKPLLEICAKSAMRRARDLNWFRYVAEDHLVADDVMHSQERARHLICAAVRVLRFMEVTGLRPANRSEVRYPDGSQVNNLPARDHSTEWFDPINNQFIMIDEPYQRAVVNAQSARIDWAKRNNWLLQASKWPGIYYPYNCSLFAATDAETDYDFDALMNKLDSLDEPLTTDQWNGVSADNHNVFTSPKATSTKDKNRAKAKGTIFRMPSKHTVPMRFQDATNTRKPNAVMPLSTHKDIGRKITAVLGSPHINGFVHSRLNSLRSELEDWLYFEHKEDKGADNTQVYYGNIYETDENVQLSRKNAGDARILESVSILLQNHYPPCAPLNRLLRMIDVSVPHLQKQAKV